MADKHKQQYISNILKEDAKTLNHAYTVVYSLTINISPDIPQKEHQFIDLFKIETINSYFKNEKDL
jgi:hypothetical protein